MVKIGVVGCSLMGACIAEVSARAGKDVVVAESSPEAAEDGRHSAGALDGAWRGARQISNATEVMG